MNRIYCGLWRRWGVKATILFDLLWAMLMGWLTQFMVNTKIQKYFYIKIPSFSLLIKTFVFSRMSIFVVGICSITYLNVPKCWKSPQRHRLTEQHSQQYGDISFKGGIHPTSTSVTLKDEFDNNLYLYFILLSRKPSEHLFGVFVSICGHLTRTFDGLVYVFGHLESVFHFWLVLHLFMVVVCLHCPYLTSFCMSLWWFCVF